MIKDDKIQPQTEQDIEKELDALLRDVRAVHEEVNEAHKALVSEMDGIDKKVDSFVSEAETARKELDKTEKAMSDELDELIISQVKEEAEEEKE